MFIKNLNFRFIVNSEVTAIIAVKEYTNKYQLEINFESKIDNYRSNIVKDYSDYKKAENEFYLYVKNFSL